MPPLISIVREVEALRVTAKEREWLLTKALIPANQDTVAKAEAWANNWLASNITTCQVVVHIFTLTPLTLTVYTANLGEQIPTNWWA